MASANSAAGEVLDRLVRVALTSTLKPAGFRKAGMTFHRRRGGTMQVVSLQLSHGTSADVKKFYINVGLAFDAICKLVGRPVLEKPKEHECDDRGTRARLEELIPGLPQSWSVETGHDATDTTDHIRLAMVALLAELDGIDGPAAYRSHRWFDRFRPKQENAQIMYLLGDIDGARREVVALARLFADRQNANRADWWVEQLGLTALKAKIISDG